MPQLTSNTFLFAYVLHFLSYLIPFKYVLRVLTFPVIFRYFLHVLSYTIKFNSELHVLYYPNLFNPILSHFFKFFLPIHTIYSIQCCPNRGNRGGRQPTRSFYLRPKIDVRKWIGFHLSPSRPRCLDLS